MVNNPKRFIIWNPSTLLESLSNEEKLWIHLNPLFEQFSVNYVGQCIIQRQFQPRIWYTGYACSFFPGKESSRRNQKVRVKGCNSQTGEKLRSKFGNPVIFTSHYQSPLDILFVSLFPRVIKNPTDDEFPIGPRLRPNHTEWERASDSQELVGFFEFIVLDSFFEIFSTALSLTIQWRIPRTLRLSCLRRRWPNPAISTSRRAQANKFNAEFASKPMVIFPFNSFFMSISHNFFSRNFSVQLRIFDI